MHIIKGENKVSAYIHGNLALEERNQKKVKIRESRKVVYRKKSIPTQEKLLYLFTVALCVLVAGVIIFRYAQIYEVNTKIQKIEQEIKLLQDENETLKLEVYKLQDPKRLIEAGKALGLKEPGEEEISEIAAKIETSVDNRVAYSE
jgi:cell division protein FtsL